MSRLVATAAWIGLAVGSLGACAPSLRMLHRSNEVFERCYAREFATDVAAGAKSACWTDWIDNFTEGQNPERIQYAERRRAALDRNEESPVLTPMVSQAESPSHASVAEGGDAGVNDAAIDAAIRNPASIRRAEPDHACGDACSPAFEECKARCTDRRSACTNVCDSELRTCREGCF